MSALESDVFPDSSWSGQSPSSSPPQGFFSFVSGSSAGADDELLLEEDELEDELEDDELEDDEDEDELLELEEELEEDDEEEELLELEELDDELLLDELEGGGLLDDDELGGGSLDEDELLDDEEELLLEELEGGRLLDDDELGGGSLELGGGALDEGGLEDDEELDDEELLEEGAEELLEGGGGSSEDEEDADEDDDELGTTPTVRYFVTSRPAPSNANFCSASLPGSSSTTTFPAASYHTSLSSFPATVPLPGSTPCVSSLNSRPRASKKRRTSPVRLPMDTAVWKLPLSVTRPSQSYVCCSMSRRVPSFCCASVSRSRKS